MARAFNPGSFRHKIDFLSPSTENDDYGEPLDDYGLFKSVKASKEPIIGKELFEALTADTKMEVKFRTRYIAGVTNEMRVKHGNDVYEIVSAIDIDTAHKELLCYCRQVK